MLLKTSRWPMVVHTGHVRYDQDSEPSKSVKRETSELPTIAETPDEPTREQQEFYHGWTHTGHVRYQYGIARSAKHRLALLSLKHSKLTWVGLSTYKTLSINMMHPS